MSTTVSTTSTNSNLASALLDLASNQNSQTPASAANNGEIDLDSLQLSGSSIDALEQQAQEIAAQNQNSVIADSADALNVNLQAVAALSQSFGQATAAQGGLDASSVLSAITL